MTAPIIIRTAIPADAAGLALVGAATMLETYADKVPGPDIVAHCANRHSEAVYAAWLGDRAMAIWAAQTATASIVGYLVLMPPTLSGPYLLVGDLEVQRIYVLSRFHGAGLGWRLMEAAVAEVGTRGGGRLVLGVLKANERAVAFYRRQGFKVIGERRFTVGASTFDDYVMGRPC